MNQIRYSKVLCGVLLLVLTACQAQAPSPAPPTAAPTAVPPAAAPTAVPPTVAPTAVPPTVAPTVAPAQVLPVLGPNDILASSNADLVGNWIATLAGQAIRLTFKEDGIFVVHRGGLTLAEARFRESGTYQFDGTELVIRSTTYQECTGTDEHYAVLKTIDGTTPAYLDFQLIRNTCDEFRHREMFGLLWKPYTP
ncbi:MAG: hypothetical protein ACT4QE_26090 [Anaerolineales bacterium]